MFLVCLNGYHKCFFKRMGFNNLKQAVFVHPLLWTKLSLKIIIWKNGRPYICATSKVVYKEIQFKVVFRSHRGNLTVSEIARPP